MQESRQMSGTIGSRLLCSQSWFWIVRVYLLKRLCFPFCMQEVGICHGFAQTCGASCLGEVPMLLALALAGA